MLPISLHPENPHYFLFRGRPTVLITSGEHYGAVLNPDFAFEPYLDELARCGFNLTRTFAGTYREVAGSFKIEENTLAPSGEKFLCPWARSEVPGYTGGGNRFDLTNWDMTYFQRLRAFVAAAGERGIVVELALFCPSYAPELWDVNPLNAKNNINGVGDCAMNAVLTLEHDDLTQVQEAMVRKLVTELKAFDNLYYEICNEPYIHQINARCAPVSDAWQARIAAVIAETERELGVQHLIAQNIANGSCRVEQPNTLVSILNFHYSNPPDCVALNDDLDRVIAYDETGFKGREDLPYRADAWDFLVAGGAVYSHLDYSFTASHPDGTFAFKTSPSGGGPELRRQLSFLKRVFDQLPFLKMKPSNEVITSGVSEGVTVRCLAMVGHVYLIYLRGGTQADLRVNLPAGRWQVEWLNPRSAEAVRSDVVAHGGGELVMASPVYQDDFVMRIVLEDSPSIEPCVAI